MISDLRFACRLFLRSPGWTAIAILSLALGIGANAAVFSLVDSVLLEPFPYRDPQQLVLLWGAKREELRRGISGADLKDWREQSRTFEDIDAFLPNLAYSLGAQETDRVKAACIGHRVLPILGVQPALGRNFTEEEARFGATPVVIISEALWRTRFGSDRAVLGRPILLDGKPYEIIGITPARFFFPDTDARLWVPAPCGISDFDRRGAVSLIAVGRTRPNVAVVEAQSDLDVINSRLARAYPETNRNVTTGVFPLRYILIGKYERALWTLLWAVGVVLLIACANVVHLQLARGVERETELAVRAASGAGRRRLLRQLLTESVLLVAVSTVAGLFLAWVGVRLIHAFALTDIPRMEFARLNSRVVGFSTLVSVAAGLLSGLWPAWRTSAVSVSDTLKLGASATTSARSHLRDLLAIGEIAAAITLLVASGLVVRSFVQLSRADWGFDPNNLVLIDVNLPRARWQDRTFAREFSEAVVTRLRAVPGIERAAVSHSAPIRWGGWIPTPVSVDGSTAPAATAGLWTVGYGYFSTAGIPIHEGREFSAEDDESSPRRIVVSLALAKRLWPGTSAVGQRISLLEWKDDLKSRLGRGGRLDPDILARAKRRDATLYQVVGGESSEVIGVVSDVRMFGLDVSGNDGMYVEARQVPAHWRYARPDLKVLVRTNRPLTEVADAAKAQILAANSEVTFAEVVSLGDLVSRSIGGRGSNKLMLIVATFFGTLAFTLAIVGIYGVVSHNVTQRLREIGIRIALGAGQRDIVRVVVGYGARLIIFGLALGLTAAWATTRGMRSLLFEITPTDTSTYATAALVLALAALAACALPLRRALRFDPVVLFKA